MLIEDIMLAEETPTLVRHCVRAVAEKHGGDTKKAFAICVKSLQKSGFLKPGTIELTAKGVERSKEHEADPDAASKLAGYEKLLKASRKSESLRDLIGFTRKLMEAHDGGRLWSPKSLGLGGGAVTPQAENDDDIVPDADGEPVVEKAKKGSKFAALVAKLSKNKGVRNPEALAAWIGRKKYGAKKFGSMSRHEGYEGQKSASVDEAKLRPGARVRVVAGSGLDSDKLGTVLDPSKVPADAQNSDYLWKRKQRGPLSPLTWVKYDDGRIETMFTARLHTEDADSMTEGRADKEFATDFGSRSKGLMIRASNWTSPADWAATMKAALYANVPKDQGGDGDTYNNFSVKKILPWLKKFKGIIVQAAREYSPALYVRGDSDTMEVMAAGASGDVEADEARIEADGTLRLWWD